MLSSFRFTSGEYARMFASCVRYQPVQVLGDACSKLARAHGVNRSSRKTFRVEAGTRSVHSLYLSRFPQRIILAHVDTPPIPEGVCAFVDLVPARRGTGFLIFSIADEPPVADTQRETGQFAPLGLIGGFHAPPLLLPLEASCRVWIRTTNRPVCPGKR
jgi:hypothetical protein